MLAGPGVGKTTVLTARIARILDSERNRNFRVLALTFTTKAGDEMRTRVEELVPGLTERTVIGTFHAFCAQVLRQHGSHLKIKPDFGVYDQDADREELLRDALREAAGRGEPVSVSDVRWLRVIDHLRLVGARALYAAKSQSRRRGWSEYLAALTTLAGREGHVVRGRSQSTAHSRSAVYPLVYPSGPGKEKRVSTFQR